jgi:hypothetical protein
VAKWEPGQEEPVVLWIDPSEPVVQEWQRERIELLTDALQGLLDASKWDAGHLDEAQRKAERVLNGGGDR